MHYRVTRPERYGVNTWGSGTPERTYDVQPWEEDSAPAVSRVTL